MTEIVAALIQDKNKSMICQGYAHKAREFLWEFVGGKVEPGETKQQVLIREGVPKSWSTDQYKFYPADEEIMGRLKDVGKDLS